MAAAAVADWRQRAPPELRELLERFDDELSQLVQNAVYIGDHSGDQTFISYSSLMIALLWGEDPTSKWLQAFVSESQIDVSKILEHRGVTEESRSEIIDRSATGDPLRADVTDVFSGSAKTVLGTANTIASEFSGPAETVLSTVNTIASETRSGQQLGVRHLLAVYIYRNPPDHERDLDNWGFDVEALRRQFAQYIRDQYPDEVDAWRDVLAQYLSETLGSAPPFGGQAIRFIDDSPKSEEDFLNRAELAFVLAARLNRIWDDTNKVSRDSDELAGVIDSARWTGWKRQPQEEESKGGFVVHIDAPWGGGKTTFSNYLVRILNPYRGAEPVPAWLADLPLHDTRFWPEAFRRPWHVATFNAWQHQHLDPPWWCLYQAIRRGCFNAVRQPAFAARVAGASSAAAHGLRQEGSPFLPDPLPVYGFGNVVGRFSTWLELWFREIYWRLFSPKILTLLLTFGLTWVAALLLYSVGLFKPESLENVLGDGISDLPAFLATGLTILFGGATAVWTIFATVTESLLSGTPDAAKNYSLGSGDPLDRFRAHFSRMVRLLKRPVIVVVDDIDRCSPGFVVELLRGMQTVFRSPRVVFVLLGDRNWIENAFANVHAAMNGINVGPEHSFGGRFVEKAIQLSLVLPGISLGHRMEYVKTLLGVHTLQSLKISDAFSGSRGKDVEQEFETILSDSDTESRDATAKSFRESIHKDDLLDDDARDAVLKEVDRRLALRSAADQNVGTVTQHRLVPIAPVLPANPRQIKRIINGISLFQEIARIEQGVQPDTDEWRKLALWVVIMTEWPQTWATLSTYPGLVDLVHDPSHHVVSELPRGKLAEDMARPVRENRDVMVLLDFEGIAGEWPPTRIDTAAVENFRAFMPATSVRLTASEEETKDAPPPADAAAPAAEP